jgi:hypothetical protein
MNLNKIIVIQGHLKEKVTLLQPPNLGKTRVLQDFMLEGEPWLGHIWAQFGVYQGQL